LRVKFHDCATDVPVFPFGGAQSSDDGAQEVAECDAVTLEEGVVGEGFRVAFWVAEEGGMGIAFIEDGDVGGGHCCDVEEEGERRGRHLKESSVVGGKFSYQAGVSIREV